jgi:hypothetical protein
MTSVERVRERFSHHHANKQKETTNLGGHGMLRSCVEQKDKWKPDMCSQKRRWQTTHDIGHTENPHWQLKHCQWQDPLIERSALYLRPISVPSLLNLSPQQKHTQRRIPQRHALQQQYKMHRSRTTPPTMQPTRRPTIEATALANAATVAPAQLETKATPSYTHSISATPYESTYQTARLHVHSQLHLHTHTHATTSLINYHCNTEKWCREQVDRCHQGSTPLGW